MSLDWHNGPLAEGLRCYRTREFFQAHEHWEAVWLVLPEPQKRFLQCLIQVAAAFHHLQRGNAIGASSLLHRSLRRLEAYPQQFENIDLESLRASIREWIDALGSGRALPLVPPSL